MRKILLVIAGMALLAVVGQVQAGEITFSTSDSPFDVGVKNQGAWIEFDYSDSGSYFIDSNDFYDLASFDLGFGLGNIQTRNFFTFDLSSLGLSDVITSATLRLTRFYSNGNLFSGGSSTHAALGFFDVSTNAAILNNNEGVNTVIYDDLGSGTSYGEFSVPYAGDSAEVLSFALNVAAISDLNSSKGGFFSIGGDLLDRSGDEVLFGGDSANAGGTQELVLNVDSTSTTTPEPTSLAIFGIGALCMGAGAARRRRKEQQAGV